MRLLALQPRDDDVLEGVHPPRRAGDLIRETSHGELEHREPEQLVEHRLEALRDLVEPRARRCQAEATIGPRPRDRLLVDLDDRDAGDAAGAQAHLYLAVRGERCRSHRLRAVCSDRQTENAAGARRIAVERVDRRQRRSAQPVELADERAAPLLEQIPALCGEPDLRAPCEQLASRRADLWHHETPGLAGLEIVLGTTSTLPASGFGFDGVPYQDRGCRASILEALVSAVDRRCTVAPIAGPASLAEDEPMAQLATPRPPDAPAAVDQVVRVASRGRS